MKHDQIIASGWQPFRGQPSPTAAGGIILSDFIEAYLASKLKVDLVDIRWLFRNDRPNKPDSFRRWQKFAFIIAELGQAFADGKVQTFIRPFDLGETRPLAPAMWNRDDLRNIFGTSIFPGWGESGQADFYWVYVNIGDADVILKGAKARPKKQSDGLFPTPTARSDQKLDVYKERPFISPSLLNVREVETIVGLSRSTIYNRIKSKEFPAPFKYGPRISRWRREVIDGWIVGQVSTD
jgi:prophage regulatory protein